MARDFTCVKTTPHSSEGQSGPAITVYDENAYAGDTRILELQANEERLLSYALDQAVEVKSQVKSHPGPAPTSNPCNRASRAMSRGR